VRRLLASVIRFFSEFLHAPCDPRLLALLRIGFASLVLLHYLALLTSFDQLWSVHGIVPLEDLYTVADGFVPTLFSVLPHSDWVARLGVALLLLHAALLLVGYRSRLQIVCVLVWLISLQNRNPLVLNGQDAVLRLTGIFLAFTPLGERWSLDRWRKGPARDQPSIGPIRLLQAQIAIVMLAAGIWKLRGDDWTSGHALYYVTRLDAFWGNLPLPERLLASQPLLKAASFGTLALELTVPIVIWFPRTRRAALAAALLFHAGLAYAMNLFLFAPIMMLGWSSFLRPEDFDLLQRIFTRLAGDTRTTESPEGRIA
jgi:hypothetical protein